MSREFDRRLKSYLGPIGEDTYDDDLDLDLAQKNEFRPGVKSRGGRPKLSDHKRKIKREIALQQDNPLYDLASTQLGDIESGLDKPFASSDANELFEHYTTTEAYVNVFDELLERAAQGERGHLDNLAGRMFADIAYNFLASGLPEDQVLLSQEHTLNLFSALHPYSQRTQSPFGLDSLIGIPVPDGLILEREGKVRWIAKKTVEYTLVRRKDFRKKIDSLDTFKISFPQVFHPKLKMHIVVPRAPEDGEDLLRNSLSRKNITELPFDAGRYRAFWTQVVESAGVSIPTTLDVK